MAELVGENGGGRHVLFNRDLKALAGRRQAWLGNVD
jgi:hypothetical protein